MACIRIGQICTLDASMAFVVVMLIMQFSILYLDLAASTNSDFLKNVESQRKAIVAGDRAIGDWRWLAFYDEDGHRTVPHTIDTGKFQVFEKGLREKGMEARVRSLDGGGEQTAGWDGRGGIVVKRIALSREGDVVVVEIKP